MPADLPATMAARLAAVPSLSLAELDASAALLTRVDHKYVTTREVAEQLVEELAGTHRVLEIGALRAFDYRSTYFDSASLDAFRAHVQGRRRRHKCRTRHYVDADRYVFEVKLKGLRGATVKHRLPIEPAAFDAPGEDALAFAARLVEADPDRLRASLVPTVTTGYSRITLAAAAQRVTLDLGLWFADPGGRRAVIAADHVIVETKGAGGAGPADLALRRRGVRPLQCSKYCLGVALLRHDVRANSLRWLLRRYFVPLAEPTTSMDDA